MAKVVVEQTDSQYIGVSYQWWKIVLYSALLGCIWWFLTLLIERIAVDPLVCGRENLTLCAQSLDISGNISAVFIAIIGVVGLVRFSVFRPLIVAGASLAVVWGLAGILKGLSVVEALAWSALVYVLAYTVFSWITRLVRTVPVIVGVLAVVIVARIVLVL